MLALRSHLLGFKAADIFFYVIMINELFNANILRSSSPIKVCIDIYLKECIANISVGMFVCKKHEIRDKELVNQHVDFIDQKVGKDM